MTDIVAHQAVRDGGRVCQVDRVPVLEEFAVEDLDACGFAVDRVVAASDAQALQAHVGRIDVDRLRPQAGVIPVDGGAVGVAGTDERDGIRGGTAVACIDRDIGRDGVVPSVDQHRVAALDIIGVKDILDAVLGGCGGDSVVESAAGLGAVDVVGGDAVVHVEHEPESDAEIITGVRRGRVFVTRDADLVEDAARKGVHVPWVDVIAYSQARLEGLPSPAGIVRVLDMDGLGAGPTRPRALPANRMAPGEVYLSALGFEQGHNALGGRTRGLGCASVGPLVHTPAVWRRLVSDAIPGSARVDAPARRGVRSEQARVPASRGARQVVVPGGGVDKQGIVGQGIRVLSRGGAPLVDGGARVAAMVADAGAVRRIVGVVVHGADQT